MNQEKKWIKKQNKLKEFFVNQERILLNQKNTMIIIVMILTIKGIKRHKNLI